MQGGSEGLLRNFLEASPQPQPGGRGTVIRHDGSATQSVVLNPSGPFLTGDTGGGDGGDGKLGVSLEVK